RSTTPTPRPTPARPRSSWPSSATAPPVWCAWPSSATTPSSPTWPGGCSPPAGSRAGRRWLWDPRAMLRGGALRVSPSVDHFHAVDERGALLRASWHHDHGFVNVSLWRGETCVETFRLEPTEAARLVA